MDQDMRKFILKLLKGHDSMTIATVRPDGYPQATTVEYANDGITLYFACDRNSQKARNIRRSGKVSLAIDRDYKDWRKIQGLSMSGRAKIVTRPADMLRGLALLARKFRPFKSMSAEDLDETALVQVIPRVISIINYRRGFGHTDLVRV